MSPDHVHILALVPPSISISKAVQYIKGISSRKLLQEFALLRKQSVADIKRSLESTDYMSGKVFMLLLAKFANRILLENPNMEKEKIYAFSDVCFGTVVSSTEIKGVVQLINSSIVYNDIESVVNSRKHQMQYIMLNLPLTVNNNEEHIISQHRDTRDITKSTDDDYRMPYSVDKADSRSFIESTYWFKEYIDNMTSEYY